MGRNTAERDYSGPLVLLFILACAVPIVPGLDLQTSARAPLPPCATPAEHEQLHIVVAWHAGTLATQCLYVGTRGSYTRRTVRVAEAAR
jgi:hypothetical protein